MRRKRILKTKLLLTFVSFILCVLVGSLLLPDSTRGSCRINDITLEKVDNFTKLTIHAERPFEFVHSTLEKKDAKPYRIVIDCKDAVHNLPQRDFRRGLPSGMIKAIRTSQFQTEPDKIVRVVLDLDKPVIYKVVDKGENNKGSVAILTSQDPDFALWSAKKAADEAPEGDLASSVAPKKTSQETSTDKDDLLTSSKSANQSENSKLKEVKKKRTTFEKTLCFADTSETETYGKISEFVASKPETKKKDAEIAKKRSKPPADKVVLADAAASSDVFSVPKPDHRELRSEEFEREKGDPDLKREMGESYSVPPLPKAKEDKSSPETQKEASQKIESGGSAREQHVQQEQLASEKQTSSAVEGPEAIAPTTEEAKAAPPQNLTSEEEEIAVSGPQEQSPGEEETELPERGLVVSGPKGTPIEAISSRETVYYQSEGRRDPFAPLTESIRTELGEIPLPTFESLKLVGVLRDQAGNRALLEDVRGYGYIMKNGDKIKNGYVISVEEDQVIFQIQEYGWSKTMTLELFNRISKTR
jgi:hypothetical protein